MAIALMYVQLVLATVIFFYRGNARELFGVEWEPWQWWLTTSIFTNYLTLYSWWAMKDSYGAWRACIISMIVHMATDIILYTLHYGFQTKYAFAMLLVALAGFIVNK